MSYFDDLLRRLRGSNPYPAFAEWTDDSSSDELLDVVRARIEADQKPVSGPQGRGLLVAAAAAVAVLVVGGGVLLFANRDGGTAPLATPPTTSAAITTTEPPATTSTTEPAVTTTVAGAQTRCIDGAPAPTIEQTLAFFAVCEDPISPPYPVYRTADSQTLQQRLEALVSGTTDMEQARGLFTGFNGVAQEVRDSIAVTLDVDSEGVATVDFLIDGERWDPGQLASASAQLFSFLDPLEATVFSDPTITGLSRSTLCWGEMGCDDSISSRATWAGALFVNYGVSPICGLDEFYGSTLGCRITENDPSFAATVVNVAADDTLNMRSGPGTEYFKVDELAPGTEVAALHDQAAVAADGGVWRVVLALDGQGSLGWVNAAYLVPSDTLLARTPEEALVDAFVAFAKDPNDATFAALPLGADVELGLGETLYRTTPAASLSNPGAWTIDQEGFRAYVGPFSAFDLLSRLGPYEVIVGPHNHCASPPLPAPTGYDGFTRISVQRLGEQSSCLQWSTVDFFITTDGAVEAITMDLWEP
ncbi:MAG: SH3 domain-containing protein [Acidimicrobiia bacterium]|nr:SH3 domain-containing protein [Acidimicrobiia bacterium]